MRSAFRLVWDRARKPTGARTIIDTPAGPWYELTSRMHPSSSVQAKGDVLAWGRRPGGEVGGFEPGPCDARIRSHTVAHDRLGCAGRRRMP